MSERGNYSIDSILGDADPAVAQTEEERILLKRYQSIYRARLSRFVQTSEAKKEYHSVSKLRPIRRRQLLKTIRLLQDQMEEDLQSMCLLAQEPALKAIVKREEERLYRPTPRRWDW